MDASMWVAKTGLDAQQTRMNVISNNLANVNTTGFKRDRAVFEDLLYQNIRQAGGQTSAATQAPTGLMLGTGVRVMATEKLNIQGNMINTQNPLDLAIAGEGHFQILQADGTVAYSRDGNFKVSATGQLVTSNGQPLQPAITIPPTAQSLTIGRVWQDAERIDRNLRLHCGRGQSSLQGTGALDNGQNVHHFAGVT